MKKVYIFFLIPVLLMVLVSGIADKSKFKIINAVETTEGAGAKVKRLYRTHILKHLDPFVIMDEFFVEKPAGFPDHPHRGFEAVTYMLDGSFRHKDNLGNDSTISTGGAQRFTAGRGIIHSEMPMSDGVNHGIQLWINLPKSLKKCDPEYQPMGGQSIPEVNKNGVKIRYVVGNGSPVTLKTNVDFQHIKATKDLKHEIKVDPTYQGYIYLIKGKVAIDKEYTIENGQALLFEPGIKMLKLNFSKETELIYIAGKPHNEPIRQHGPFVD